MAESDQMFYALGKQVCAAAELLSATCTAAEYQGGLRMVISMLEMEWRASVRKASIAPAAAAKDGQP